MANFREKIPKFEAGQKTLSAGHLNQLVRAAKVGIKVTPPLTITDSGEDWLITLADFPEMWIGKVDASGEPSDYTDSRYFVKKVKVTSSDANLTFAERTFPTSDSYTVTNLAEKANGTHNLNDSDYIIVYEVNDAVNRKKYVTMSGGTGGGSDVAFGKPVGWGGSGTYVTVDPCTQAGATLSEADIKVHLCTDKSSTYASFTSDSILRYSPYSASDTDGGWGVLAGWPVMSEITVVTDWRYNSDTHYFQKKTRSIMVPVAGSDSGWVNAQAATAQNVIESFEIVGSDAEIVWEENTVYVLGSGVASETTYSGTECPA